MLKLAQRWQIKKGKNIIMAKFSSNLDFLLTMPSNSSTYIGATSLVVAICTKLVSLKVPVVEVNFSLKFYMFVFTFLALSCNWWCLSSKTPQVQSCRRTWDKWWDLLVLISRPSRGLSCWYDSSFPGSIVFSSSLLILIIS